MDKRHSVKGTLKSYKVPIQMSVDKIMETEDSNFSWKSFYTKIQAKL
jgi:hypothetical protein